MWPKISAGIYLAKRGLPFRAHIDNGPIPTLPNISAFTGEGGNFRSLLQLLSIHNLQTAEIMKSSEYFF